MMHESNFPAYPAHLEVRARGRGRELYARFPLGRVATVRSSGKVRKERFAGGNGGASVSWQHRKFQELNEKLAEVIKGSFDEAARLARIEELEDALERRNSFMLVGHSYDKTIADARSGNLALRFSDDAAELTAQLPEVGTAPSWVEDAARAVEHGQLRGVSPGFSVGAKGGEKLIPEVGNPAVLIRELTDTVVWEWSLVSRPAFSGTSASVRADELTPMVRTPRRRIWYL